MEGIPPIPAYPLPTAQDLPPSVMSWKTDPTRCLLLIHDMQRYFLAPFAEPLRSQLLANVTALRERCARSGVPVAYTAQPGDMSSKDRGLLQDVWGPGMSSTPEHRGIVPELAPAPGDRVHTKWRYSAFHRTRLLEQMREEGRDQLVLCGVYAHVGIQVSAVEAFSHDIETFLVADGVADFSPQQHAAALTYASGRCARVLLAEEVCA